MMPTMEQTAADPVWRSDVPCVVWPAVGSDASAHLQSLLFQLEHSQWLTEAEICSRQLFQLKQLVRHAQETAPCYGELMSGLDVASLDWTVFRSLPVLSRKELQGSFERLKSTAVPPSHGAIVAGQSSGSTGMPVRFLQTAATQLFWNALTLREHFWHERNFSGKLAAIRIKVEEGRLADWGPPVSLLFLTGPGAALNVRTDVEEQLEWLQRENPDYLITHASNLAVLAELTLRRGVRLPNLRQVRSYSEALRPDLRELVRAAWGVEVADIYSCEEAGHIALQCPGHEHYHVQSENLVVEVLDEDGRPCRPGETGRVVLTTLHNFAMPLIRYEIGDYAEVGEPCSCGRGLPVLKRIHGRRRNMIALPDGRRHWPSFPAEMWREVAPVEQFRLVQRTPEEIEACYVMARELTQEEKARLEAALASRFGYPFRIAWKRSDALDRGPGYKFEDFISEL